MSSQTGFQHPPPRRSLAALVTWALLAAMPAPASETVLLNGSPAYDCYRAVADDGAFNDIEVCTLAIEKQMLTPADLAATYSNRGILHVRSGDVAAGLKDHNRALALAPHMTSIYINRSNALVAAKRYQAALADLEWAIGRQDALLPIAYYNRALMFNTLGDREAARADAQQAAELAPETEAYRRFLQALVP